MRHSRERGFNLVELILVIVIIAVLFVVLTKDDESSSADLDASEEVPIFVKLWPFGPDGWICQHIAPVSYTEAGQSIFSKLGGCYRHEIRSPEERITNLNNLLIRAVSEGNPSQVDILLNNGAEVNLRMPQAGNVPAGTTPLMIAATKNYLNVVKALLSKNADVNVADAGGGTALIYATWKGNVDIVKLLLEKNAAVDVKTTDGRTPMSIAESSNNIEIIEILNSASNKN